MHVEIMRYNETHVIRHTCSGSEYGVTTHSTCGGAYVYLRVLAIDDHAHQPYKHTRHHKQRTVVGRRADGLVVACRGVPARCAANSAAVGQSKTSVGAKVRPSWPSSCDTSCIASMDVTPAAINGWSGSGKVLVSARTASYLPYSCCI